MNSLFHFIHRRPVMKKANAVSIALVTDTSFQQKLESTAGSDAATPDDIKAVARNYYEGNEFIHDPSKSVAGKQLLGFVTRARSSSSEEELDDIAENIFRSNLVNFIADPDFKSLLSNAADTIVALKILFAPYDGVDLLLDIVRGGELLRKVAIKDPSLSEPQAISKALRATVVLPGNIFPLNLRPKKIEAEPLEEPDSKKENTSPYELVKDLEFTLRELLRINSTDLEPPEQTGGSQPQGPTQAGAIRVSSKPMKLKAETIERLSNRAKKTLEDINVDLRSTSWIGAVKLTRYALNIKIDEIDWTETDLVGDAEPVAPFLSPVGPASMPIPHIVSCRKIEPAGFGDLIVVKQQIKQYEMGEVAHIENVLKSETKDRTHVRREYTETTTTTEVETENERERDQQFTERSEMERETTKTIQEEDSLKAGATISASYGPFVEFSASVEYETSENMEESIRQANRYAREIVERSAERISERVREERVRKVINEIEETNFHSYNNSDGDEHIIGIYQWVDKVYEVRAFKYDKRLLFDVIIPEPGVFLAQAALEEKLPKGVLPKKPRTFFKKASQIRESNYLKYAHRYGATVAPPPEDLITIVKSFKHLSEAGGEGPSAYAETAEVVIDPGYRAIYGYSEFALYPSHENYYIDSWLGEKHYFIKTPVSDMFVAEDGPAFIHNEVGKISAGVVANEVKAFAQTLEIHCIPTDRAITQWQIETHDAIMQAYLNQKTIYDQALEALLAEKGSEILGRNPLENRQLERDELKKFMLSMLTNQDFRDFNAVETAADPGAGYSQVDIDRAIEQEPYIRFCEQAFEWVNMMYVLYPYFWGRKDEWINKLQIESSDPEYVNFLRAGAARVVLPVRPGFEPMVLSYLETGEASNTLNDVNSPQYLSILEEIKEQAGVTGEQPEPYGERFEIRLPTSLIKLCETSDLPRWER